MGRPKGSRNRKGRAKLSDHDVVGAAVDITRGQTASSIAAKLGVNVNTVIRAVTGKTACYAHLQSTFDADYVAAMLRYNIGNRALDPYLVIEIRRRIAAGEQKCAVYYDIANRCGVHFSTVAAAASGRTWSWVRA